MHNQGKTHTPMKMKIIMSLFSRVGMNLTRMGIYMKNDFSRVGYPLVPDGYLLIPLKTLIPSFVSVRSDNTFVVKSLKV